ncbi:MAG: histone deacetylase, partial [Candidatus Binatia bacterium]
MRSTGIVTDTRFRDHDPGPGHPERPERLEVLEALLGLAPYRDLPRIAAREATEEEIERVHEGALLAEVAASAGRPSTRFDADTAASAGSFEAARLAAGGAVELADAVLRGDVDNGFAALRPPGHHAERDRAMGFCLFNNVAVVARHLRQVRGLDRVLILDWDVH